MAQATPSARGTGKVQVLRRAKPVAALLKPDRYILQETYGSAELGAQGRDNLQELGTDSYLLTPAVSKQIIVKKEMWTNGSTHIPKQPAGTRRV